MTFNLFSGIQVFESGPTHTMDWRKSTCRRAGMWFFRREMRQHSRLEDHRKHRTNINNCHRCYSVWRKVSELNVYSTNFNYNNLFSHIALHSFQFNNSLD